MTLFLYYDLTIVNTFTQLFSIRFQLLSTLFLKHFINVYLGAKNAKKNSYSPVQCIPNFQIDVLG